MQPYKNYNYGFHTESVTTLFLGKRNFVHSIFDIFFDKIKCQILPVAYHLFQFF